MDLQTGLLFVIALLLGLLHMRRTDCQERTRAAVNEALRENNNRWKENSVRQFVLYRDALEAGRESHAGKEPTKPENQGDG